MAATVRSPGARIAPIKSTLAHSHTRSLKTASKWRNTCIIPFGRVSIFSFSFGRILREAYSVFPFLSSDWIKSRSFKTGHMDLSDTIFTADDLQKAHDYLSSVIVKVDSSWIIKPRGMRNEMTASEQ